MKRQTLSLLAGSLASVFIASPALAEGNDTSMRTNTRQMGAQAETANIGPNGTVRITPKKMGEVEFITGGIGDEERNAIEAVKNNYNLHVMSAGQDGAFTGTTRVTILNQNNKKVLETDMGPLFYAQLPPGTYTVEGTYNNKTRSQKVDIARGADQPVHFSWK